jgi:hypothetical protein
MKKSDGTRLEPIRNKAEIGKVIKEFSGVETVNLKYQDTVFRKFFRDKES